MPFAHEDQERARPKPSTRFDTTQWSLIAAASRQGLPDAQEALSTLCSKYWYPLYAYVRRRGYSVEDAKDLTQGFFLRLVEKNSLAHADRARGRFRSFLLSSLDHFLSNEWDRLHAKRRGGGAQRVSLDCDNAETRYRLEPVDTLTPELLFERRWAAALIGAVLTQLQTELASTGKQQLFASLKGFLTADDPRSYAQVAQALGMTEAAVKVAVHRLRRRFRALLRAEVAQTVTDENEIDDEIRYLMARIGAV